MPRSVDIDRSFRTAFNELNQRSIRRFGRQITMCQSKMLLAIVGIILYRPEIIDEKPFNPFCEADCHATRRPLRLSLLRNRRHRTCAPQGGNDKAALSVFYRRRSGQFPAVRRPSGCKRNELGIGEIGLRHQEPRRRITTHLQKIRPKRIPPPLCTIPERQCFVHKHPVLQILAAFAVPCCIVERYITRHLYDDSTPHNIGKEAVANGNRPFRPLA